MLVYTKLQPEVPGASKIHQKTIASTPFRVAYQYHRLCMISKEKVLHYFLLQKTLAAECQWHAQILGEVELTVLFKLKAHSIINNHDAGITKNATHAPPGIFLTSSRSYLNLLRQYCKSVHTCTRLEFCRMVMHYDEPGLEAPGAPCKIPA